jgi:hypothetical protein
VPLHNLGNCVRQKVHFQQGKFKPRPDPRRRVEGSPDLSPESNLGKGNVCQTNLVANLPNQMGLFGTTTSNTPEQTTRRNTTFWGLHTTSGGRETRRRLGRLVSTRPVPTREKWTKQRNSATMYESTGRTSPKNKGAYHPLLAKDNRIPVKAICQASRLQLYDMPGLQKYRDSTSRSTICSNNLLKGCGWTKCLLRKVG